MPITVEQILKQSGISDEQIKALDAKLLQGFSTVAEQVNAAESAALAAKEEAERVSRAQKDMYENQIAPALDNWATEKANLEAERAFYRTQNEQARSGGFVPKDAPTFKAGDADTNAGRDNNGRFVPGANAVPGSPQYMTMEQGLTALTNAHAIANEYFRLFREPMPDDFGDLLKQAAAEHMDARAYANKKYGFDTKRAEITAAKQKEHDDKIRAEAAEATRKEMAEKFGSNPNVRVPSDSRFTEIAKGVQAGTLKDPLKMTQQERHRATSEMVQKDVAASMVQ